MPVTITLDHLSTDGTGTVRVMAAKPDGTPAIGQTVVTLLTPTEESVELANIFVSFGKEGPDGGAEGRLFDFTIPDLTSHGRYHVNVAVRDGELSGSMSFKF